MRIIISGASRGLGKSIAEKLCSEGNDLLLLSKNEENLRNLKSTMVLKKHQNVDFIAVDLSKPSEIEKLKKNSWFSDVDVLINNLGVYTEDSAEKISLEALENQLKTNLFSAIHLSQNVLQSFKQKQKGTIININSVMGQKSAAFASSYSISKHALKAWCDALREEQRKNGIKVCSVYPGAINTSSWDGEDVDRKAMIQPEDIAELLVCLLKLSPHTLVEELHLSPLNFTP